MNDFIDALVTGFSNKFADHNNLEEGETCRMSMICNTPVEMDPQEAGTAIEVAFASKSKRWSYPMGVCIRIGPNRYLLEVVARFRDDVTQDRMDRLAAQDVVIAAGGGP